MHYYLQQSYEHVANSLDILPLFFLFRPVWLGRQHWLPDSVLYLQDDCCCCLYLSVAVCWLYSCTWISWPLELALALPWNCDPRSVLVWCSPSCTDIQRKVWGPPATAGPIAVSPEESRVAEKILKITIICFKRPLASSGYVLYSELKYP